MYGQTFRAVLIAAVLGFCTQNKAADVSLTSDGKVPGVPFQQLQQQINTLTSRLQTIEAKVDGLAGGGRLKVIDATNTQVGTLVQQNMMLHEVNGELTGLVVHKDGFDGADLQLFYETSDCTGPGYVVDLVAQAGPDFNLPNNSGLTLGGGATVTLYRAVNPQIRVIASTRVALRQGTFSDCSPFIGQFSIGTPEVITTITITPPLRLVP
jgi:hypothetical protein